MSWIRFCDDQRREVPSGSSVEGVDMNGLRDLGDQLKRKAR